MSRAVVELKNIEKIENVPWDDNEIRDGKTNFYKACLEDEVNNSTNLILYQDLHGKIKVYNRESKKKTNYRKNKVRNVKWLEIILEKKCEKGLKSLLKSNKVYKKNYIHPIITNGGEERIISWSFPNLKNPELIIGFGEDITEKEKISDKLIPSKIYEAIFDQKNDAILLFDLITEKLCFVNKKACELFGYNKKEFLNLDISNILPKENFSSCLKVFDYLADQNILTTSNMQLLKKSGVETNIEATCLQITIDEKKYLTLVLTDITKIKEFEKDKNQTNQNFEKIIESSPDAIITTDLHGKITFFSDGAESIFGYKKEEVIGKKAENFYLYGKDEPVKIMKILEQNGKVKNYESIFISKDKRKIPVNISVSLLKEDNGKIIGTIGVAKDITKQKIVEKKLKESEGRFLSIIENSHNGILIVNENFIITYINEEIIRILDYPKKEIIGQDFRKLIDCDSKIQIDEKYLHRKRGESILNEYDFKIVRRDGEKKDVEIKTIHIQNNIGQIRTIIQMLDISERKKAEQEIIYLKEYNEEILQSVKSGIVATDKDLNVLTWNFYMEEYYGLKKEKIIGKNLLKCIPQLKKEKLDKILYDVLSTGKTFKEYMVIHKSKKGTRYYNITISARKNLEEKVIGILMNWDDVTDLAKIGAKLSTIYQLSKDIILLNNEEEILENGLDAINNVLQFRYCSIIFKDSEKDELYVKAHRGYSKNIKKFRIPLNNDLGIINVSYNLGKTFNIPNVKKEIKYDMFDPKIKSEIAIPLKIREETIGVINVESKKINAFDESDKKLLMTLASSISSALDNIYLHGETEKRAKSLESLNHIGRAISSTLDLDKIFKILYTQMGNILDTKNLYIALYDKNEHKLNFEIEVENNKLLPKRKRKYNHGLSEFVIRNKKPLLIKKNFNEECNRLGINPFGKEAKSWLGVPLVSKSKAIGVITIQSFEKENAFDVEQLRVISTIADQLSIAIENSKLYNDLEKRHKELEDAYESLKEMNKIKDEFLTITSHEFGTPITILKGNVNMFQDETLGEITELQRKQMDAIYSSVERLVKIRDQTILLSNLDSGRLILNNEKVNLNKLINEIIKGIRVEAEKKNQEISTHLSQCKITCDKEAIIDVIKNLISNAIKYSGENTKIKISMKPEKDNIHLIISDNGVGIGKEHLDKLFNRFYIAHNFLNHKQGTGLGLAIVREIVEAHGGNVYCKSKLNKGCEFHVLIPKICIKKSNNRKILNEIEGNMIENKEMEILESLDTGIIVINKDFKIKVWNDYMVEHYGASKEVIGKNIYSCFPKMKKEGFIKLFEKVITGERIREYLVEQDTKIGIRYFNIFMSPRKNKDGSNNGILMKWEDVTDLAGLGQRLSILYELTHKMIFCNNDNEVFNMSLEALKDTLKFKKCSIILKGNEKSFKHIVKDKKLKIININKKDVNDIVLSALLYGENKIGIKPKTKIKSEIAIPIKIRNEIIGVIDIKSQKINEFDEGDEKLLTILASEIATSLDNINLYHEIEEKNKELQNMYNELKELDDMKSEFIAISAHEIGTPLTIIKGNIEMLRDGNFGKINKTQRKRLNVVNKNIERINTLSKDSLILSKIDSKRLRLDRKILSFSKFTKNIVEEMKPLAKMKGLSIVIKENKDHNAYFDVTTMTQVMNNLLSNAMKFTPDKGKICISLENGKNKIQLSIKDNGIGIPKKELNKIFERFYMVESHLHHKEGSGLGLSIVKEIIELHKGKVWVESKENKGTTFHFTLPVK